MLVQMTRIVQAGQPVDLVDHDHINFSGLDVGHQVLFSSQSQVLGIANLSDCATV